MAAGLGQSVSLKEPKKGDRDILEADPAPETALVTIVYIVSIVIIVTTVFIVTVDYIFTTVYYI